MKESIDYEQIVHRTTKDYHRIIKERLSSLQYKGESSIVGCKANANELKILYSKMNMIDESIDWNEKT